MEAEGRASFLVDGVSSPCETWYKVFGDLTDPFKTPLFVLHGGPMAGHEYLLSLQTLSEPVIFYDQIGCGQSSEVPEKSNDESFWTSELFCRELSNLVTHLGLGDRPIDLLGHSWGGMLAAELASGPFRAQTRRLIIYGSPASIEGHVEGLEEVRKGLPGDAQEALRLALQNREFSSPPFNDAMRVFSERYMSLTRPFPCDEIKPAFTHMATSKAHKTMFGPAVIAPWGSLRNWSSIPYLHQISAPTLLIRGSEEYIRESAMQPFFDHIPKIKWITFNDAAHFSHIEQREKFFDQVRRFLE